MKRTIWAFIICALLLGGSSAAAIGFSSGGEPTTSSTPSESATPNAQPQPSSLPGLDALVEAWKAHGVQVLEVQAEGQDASSVVVKVPESALTGSAAISTSYQLHRQPAVLRKSGIVVHLLTIVGVNDAGEERVYAKANIDDLVPAQELVGESTVAESEARASVEGLVADEAQKRGIAPPKVTWDSSVDGLLVTVEVVDPASGDGELGGFVDVVNGRMASLDQEGAGISQMIMRVVDETGKQVALELQDYDLAFGWRSLWMAPEMTKAGDRPEFAPIR